ncbi:12882_t:CDS:2 [Funneliformis geosporum]|uniref:2839_t:CDS:1 n=1 Tax=Funneliformis geosporum TaxID=1117311 RepID=A0A9W4SG56_9GLOM|nr:2839_t:CDS:2 [Funneliformis geosporum]CAI2170961.1 12882_t:CDS:2 [Funneliformis geosporum]
MNSPSYQQDDIEVSSELNKMSLDNIMDMDDCEKTSELEQGFGSIARSTAKGALCIAQNFEAFSPYIKVFLALGRDIITLYEKAEHHKELCSSLLQRCNCAMATVKDLFIRKTENKNFFSKPENLHLFQEFIACIKRIRNFIGEISQLSKFKKFFFTNNIGETFQNLIAEFDGFMNSLNFTFTIQSNNNLATMKNDMKQIMEKLSFYDVPNDKQSQQNFFNDVNSVAGSAQEFKRQTRKNKTLDSSEVKILDENEPLLSGNQYQKTSVCPTKKIEKRINDGIDYSFKEFSNTASDQTQIEIRRQVNILKKLKNANHIIRFFGVAQENSKFYLITEWMEHGNLQEYYTNFKEMMTWVTKIRFALDICCGISYLNDCEILHRDIQSANILINTDQKAKIANFGLSRKFSELTRNISPNIENVRYMAPEKLSIIENDRKKSTSTTVPPYDSKCEIYSIGALLWEIAELKKPHSDLNKSDVLLGIRERVNDRYCLPFSDEVPPKWKALVKDDYAGEPEVTLSMDYQSPLPSSFVTITILPISDAIRTHKSKTGNKQLAWQSFKYHSSTNIEAKYWLGYYYYHHGEIIPELKQIDKEERIRMSIEIFKETADKGNPSAQLRYGLCLMNGEGVDENFVEAFRYLKDSANQGNTTAMYIIGKAYWNGGVIIQDKEQGTKYLKCAALENHPKAKEMYIIIMYNFNFLPNKKKRSTNDDQSTNTEREPKVPRINILRTDDLIMDVDANSTPSLSPYHSSCPSPSNPSPSNPVLTYNDQFNYWNPQDYNSLQYYQYNQPEMNPFFPANYMTSQDDNGVSGALNRMTIGETNEAASEICVTGTVATLKGACSVAQNFETFIPFVTIFLKLGEEIINLYDKAKHNKELCGILLQRCNGAMAAVRDLDMRKTENAEFFSKQENLNLFKQFIKCMEKIKKFILRVSKLHKLIKYLWACSIEQDLTNLITEFDGYMRNLNFSFIVQSRDELGIIKGYVGQIKELLFNVYGVSDNNYQDFLKNMNSITVKNIEFQRQERQDKSNVIINSSEVITNLERNEPLLDGRLYDKAMLTRSKRIEKRLSVTNCTEVSFKEFSNTNAAASSETGNGQSHHQTQTQAPIQIEIRKQVNILKELKDSDHIIRFFGVAQEDSKFYLVTEWMEHGNLFEYYTTFKDNMNWETKIRFALDICRGVAYLHECKILHHDIQSANILVNKYHKVRIANFGLSKKFSDITRNISHNLENIRYMAPEKLLLDNEENNNDFKKKSVSYDAKCEVYSVGALLWEIAELKKPHSDLDKSELLGSIRKRVRERINESFSDDVPVEWRQIVSRAMEYLPTWRPNISDICRDFYKLNEHYSEFYSRNNYYIENTEDYKSFNSRNYKTSSSVTINILSVNDAIREHKSNDGNRQLAWDSFKYHSSTNIEAKYWLGYYYYHHGKDIPELQSIREPERIKMAVDIFKETADRGNPSAQLRYGICLWKGEGIPANSLEASRYLKYAADSGNSTAMYIIGKAYWNGGNGIGQDKEQGARYLRDAALHDHPKAIEMCNKYKIMV